MQWYFARDGQACGPVAVEELRRMADSGELKPEDLVWTERMGDQWAAASTVPELFPQGLPAVPGEVEAPAVPAGPRGMTPNRDLMREAREALRNRWGLAVGAVLLYWLVSFAAGAIPYAGVVTGMILSGPLSVGFCVFFLALARRREPAVGQLFDGFKSFGTAIGAYFLMILFILLWTLLFIIPGIIACYAYAMTWFVIADDPAVGPLEAITRSKLMMRGRKWKYFCLNMRFIGWGILCLLTCGVGFLWLIPYVQTALAAFYDDVRPGS